MLLSPELNAAVRAIQGESDLDAVWPVFGDVHLSRVVASAPDTQRIVRAVAALRNGLPALLDPPTIADPALHDAVARMIGAPEGWDTLMRWTQFAPAGWGAKRADALVDAVTNTTCSAGCAAALIGPCDASARLLRTSSEIAFAIRRWGESSPDEPTAWMHALSAEARDRLLDAVSGSPYDSASCIPWLPPDTANQKRIKDEIGVALAAFAEASLTARARHAALVQRLVAQATSRHLDALTLLACVMKEEDVWRRAETLIRSSPGNARIADIAAHWDDLDARVRDAILACAKKSDICAAIAAAQGQRDVTAMHISETTAAAFVAALKPGVWDALGSDVRRQWLDALQLSAAHRAVRSLGLRPEFLAQAWLDNDLVRAVRTHACDDATLHWTLLPVALRNLPPDAVHALITALPTPPPDPGAFFCIASKHPNPDMIASVEAPRCTNVDLACVVALQRCVDNRFSVRIRSAALRHALCGRAWSDLEPIMALLDDNARLAITPDIDALVKPLAHPNRREALRQALTLLASLPPEVAIPTCVALDDWTLRYSPDAANAIADALRDHGDVLLAIVDALGDEHLRATLLPLPADEAKANALRDLARDAPLAAHRLAHALRGQKWRTALHALLTAPPHAADAVWQALTDNVRSDIVAAVAPTPPHGAPIITRDSFAALALAAVRSGDDDLLAAGIAALAARPEHVRTIWDRLSQEAQQALHDHLAFVDLPITHARPQKPPSSRRRRG